jgi:uncharacterized protein
MMQPITIAEARAWYAGEDAVHNFAHVLRVYELAERIASAEGANLEIVHAAVLLHDAEGAADAEGENDDADNRRDHHEISAEFARQELAAKGWPQEQVNAAVHCILAHRFRRGETPQTLEAQVVFDADKLDAIGAIGVARALAYAVQAGQPFYAEPSPQFVECGQRQPDEPHSAYHEFIFKLRNIKTRMFTPTGKAIAAQRDAAMSAYFEQLQAEMQGWR